MAARLVIEVDGATHGTDEEIAHDTRRTAFLKREGWRVMRVTNNDVRTNLYGVVDAIILAATSPLRPSGAPPP